jgi:hypothetical protein
MHVAVVAVVVLLASPAFSGFLDQYAKFPASNEPHDYYNAVPAHTFDLHLPSCCYLLRIRLFFLVPWHVPLCGGGVARAVLPSRCAIRCQHMPTQ